MPKKTLSVFFIFALCFIALTLSAFSPAPLASGETAKLQITRTPISQAIDQQMTFTLQRERNWLQREGLHLNWATQIAQKAQEIINKAQQDGLDVTALQNALNTFNAQIPTAQSSYNQAASILASPAGFDGSGNVTNAQTAHQTLASARDALQQTHLTLANASLSLRTAFQNWRIQHNL